MPLQIGRRLGPYEIQSALGAGGMGEVYKRATPVWSAPSRSKSFPRTSRQTVSSAIVSSMKPKPFHSSITRTSARCTTSARKKATSFLVMQYLEGETLADRLTRGPAPGTVVTRYDVTHDGQRFLLNLNSLSANAIPQIKVVLNWATGLEQ